MCAFEKLPWHVGHNEQKKALLDWSSDIITDPRCYAMYFEARGGLGKTHLLSLYPQLVLQASEQQPELTRLRITNIVDFYNFESRSPLVIEQRLIEGLKYASGAEWHALPPEEVDTAFRAYNEMLEQRRRSISGRAKTAITAMDLHRAFIECWNRLARSHPLVIRFDTVETLQNQTAPPEALINIELQFLAAHGDMPPSAIGIESVQQWMTAVLPRLEHTLVIMSGRPVGGSEFIQSLIQHGVLSDDARYVLEPLSDLSDIRDYLSGCGVSGIERFKDNRLQQIKEFTEGYPLMLTWYAELFRSDWAFPPNVLHASSSLRRINLEERLIETILHPLNLADSATRTLAYCFYFLGYARRGLTRDELRQLFDEMKLERDDVVLEQLEYLSLIKTISWQQSVSFFLHDEVARLLDTSGILGPLGMGEATLRFLSENSRRYLDQREALPMRNQAPSVDDGLVSQQSDQVARLKAMSSHMYYELTRHFQVGYWAYVVYMDQLLGERRVDDAMVLADAFWSTLEYRVTHDGHERQPYYERLHESPLELEGILRDERVRQAKLLRAIDQNSQALQLVTKLHAEFTRDEQIAALGYQASADPHLHIDLSLVWAATTMSEDISPRGWAFADALYRDIIAFLEAPSAGAHALLETRKLFFLGQAYTLRGHLLYQQERFSEAIADALRGRRAFKQHLLNRQDTSAENPQIQRDNVIPDLAQATNNLAYNLAQTGELKRALRLTNEVIKEYVAHVSDYHQALFYNTQALIYLYRGQTHEAEEPIRLAIRAAEQSGINRAIGLVTEGRARLEQAKMSRQNVPNPAIERYYEQALQHLAEESGTRRSILGAQASFYRAISALYHNEQDYGHARHYNELALTTLDDALAAIDDGPSVRRADLTQGKAVIHINMGEFDKAIAELAQAEEMMQRPMPEYGQVVAGKIAIQRAIIALDHEANVTEALRLMTIGLARANIFAPHHQVLDTFEQMIQNRIKGISQRYPNESTEFLSLLDEWNATDSFNQLQYQQPNPHQWPSAWNAAIGFMSIIL
ncbi:MAG TPA: hypothetical protein VGE07_25105 [Herpetosiphonaceae bacterium]